MQKKSCVFSDDAIQIFQICNSYGIPHWAPESSPWPLRHLRHVPNPHTVLRLWLIVNRTELTEKLYHSVHNFERKHWENSSCGNARFKIKYMFIYIHKYVHL